MISNELVLKMAQYIIDTGTTIRDCAKKHHVSKSCVHQSMHKKLPNISQMMYERVLDAFSRNLKERHSRGGKTTAQMWKCGKIMHRNKVVISVAMGE